MQLRPDPRRWLIVAYLEYAAGRLDLGRGAPPRNECARECRIGEVEIASFSTPRIPDGVIAHP